MAALGAGGGMTLASTILSAGGNLYAGMARKKGADSEAEQLARKAKTRRAEAGRAADEERRQSRLMQSRAQAVIASGGALSDPSSVNAIADLEAEGEYRALTRMWEGEEEAGGYDAAAAARKKEGRAARLGGGIQAVSSILSGVETLRSKYG